MLDFAAGIDADNDNQRANIKGRVFESLPIPEFEFFDHRYFVVSVKGYKKSLYSLQQQNMSITMKYLLIY